MEETEEMLVDKKGLEKHIGLLKRAKNDLKETAKELKSTLEKVEKTLKEVEEELSISMAKHKIAKELENK